ncbi:bestrophin-2 isoform X2 [Leptinotarsa decemlineata]|uniref:bestrophin-2 isoform X2 n=1 Tax=Leptinotarsa decemlineata TaxID=7539 RepID=UPI003D30A009
MTVSYTAEVSSSTSGLGCFLKLLKRHFRAIVEYCAKNGSLIPLSFFLGFYVSIVYKRWWTQYTSIPCPDNIAILVGANIKGRDERSRIFRRTIVRYICVAFTMTLSLISPKAKKRFPTLRHYVETGLMSENEQRIIQNIDNEYPNYTKYWLPLAWAANVTTRARHEGIIKHDVAVNNILNEINIFRSKLSSLLDYDWISVPLVYTQVVTLTVYSYFMLTVIGNQFLSMEGEGVFIFSLPIVPILEFFFYMGWLKVAETLINPFGEDDDDFEVMWMIDRNVQVCYLLVDRIHQEHPKLEKDFYWDKIAPICLPFTVAAQEYIGEFPQSSTRKVVVKNTEKDLILPEYESQTDGRQEAGASKYWSSNERLFSKYTRRHIEDVPLSQVIDVQVGDDTSNNQENGGNTSFNRTADSLNSEIDHFAELIQSRLRNRKEVLHKYMKILKSMEDQEQIINDILK